MQDEQNAVYGIVIIGIAIGFFVGFLASNFAYNQLLIPAYNVGFEDGIECIKKRVVDEKDIDIIDVNHKITCITK